MTDTLTEQSRHYQAVAQAIQYIKANVANQPALKDIAAAASMSEHHFQRTFSRWVGISPKRFLQYLTKESAKQQLQQSEDLLTTALQSGLSGPGRLHELIVSCEGMSPGEIKSGGAGLSIHYGLIPTPFGEALVGWTERGVCYLHFVTHDASTDALLSDRWSAARLVSDEQGALALGEKIFQASDKQRHLHLLLRGTNFQLKVWEALLRVPSGHLVSYASLADMVGKSGAQRAVGSAVGRNDIGFLIPCHRVIKSDGDIGQYRWDAGRKFAMLGFEQAQFAKHLGSESMQSEIG